MVIIHRFGRDGVNNDVKVTSDKRLYDANNKQNICYVEIIEFKCT